MITLKKFPWKLCFAFVGALFVLLCLIQLGKHLHETRVLKQIIQRLEADSRVAEVLVTKSEFDEASKKVKTTVKFLEYDALGKPLEPKYFNFHGNIIQFQTLVIRFKDELVRKGDRLRGKSAYLFMKAFVLDGKKTQVFPIAEVYEVPQGYKIPGAPEGFEKEIWRDFWNYALDPKMKEQAGIKNAQIEAPGSLFLPGSIYTLRIEHDGGIRIDSEPLSPILQGETIQ